MDLSNSSLILNYENGTNSSVDITPSMVSGFNTSSVGSFTYTIMYQGFTDVVNYTVSKRDPLYSVPAINDIEYSEGLLLSDIELPSGFTWDNPDRLLELGEYVYDVTYTPSDLNKYNIINNIKVNVNVVLKTTPIIIYEVYGGGGNTGAIYNTDYVVLYNTTNNNINLNGYSLQYGTSTGSSYSVISLSGTIYAKNYYLISLAGGANGSSLPISANLSGTTSLSATAGKIALTNSTNAITSKDDLSVIDFVGYGTANEAETSPTGSTSNAKSIKRLSKSDTDNNLNDFNVVTPDLTYLVENMVLEHIVATNLKTHYVLGSALDVTNGILELQYSNGSFTSIPITVDMVSGFNSSTVGSRQLTITYLGLVTTYEYYIVDYSSLDKAYVYYIDLGATGGKAGEAALIKVGGTEVLIDSGDNDTNSKNELLSFLGTVVTDGVIEYIIATHPDGDHIGGMTEVLSQYQVNNVIQYSTAPTSTNIRSEYELAVANEGSNVYKIADLVSSATPYVEISSGVVMKFYNTNYLTSGDTNASSIVFVLEALGTRVLFNGDAETPQENVYRSLVGDVDILKMGHHGTTNGTSDELLNTVKPEVVVVNNGNFLGNSYGHPTYEALYRVYKYSNNVPVYSVTGGNGPTSDRMFQRNGDLSVAIGSKGYSITSQYYGLNPIELSATDYWKSTSNPNNGVGYYYANASGIDISTLLKANLHDIIDDHVTMSYDAAWYALMKTDEDPNNSNNVILFYTGRSQAKTTNGGGVNDWNREHVWAKSHGGFGTTAPAGTDIHHLRPTDVSVNSSRGSLDFDNGGERVGDLSEYGPNSTYSYRVTGVSFEPRDEVKGDVARIIFYMAVRYEGDKAGEPNLEINNLVNNGTNPYMGRLSVLLQWHIQDPVDDFERNRNNVIYSYQKNRNPFIDHPEYVGMVFGSN